MTNMNQNGRSMIEMLGVLAIIGVLSVGGIAGYSKAMLKFRTNKTIDEISMLVTNIRTLYAQQTSYNKLNGANATDNDGANAYKMGIVPDEMVVLSGGNFSSLKNPFNGLVTIQVENSTGSFSTAEGATQTSANAAADGTNRAFSVTFNGLPKQACLEMAVNDWGSNYSSGLIAMAIAKDSASGTGTGNVKAITTEAYTGCTIGMSETTSTSNANNKVVCASAMPLKVSEAAAACECTSGNSCSMTFKYY